MTVTINGSSGITAPEVILDNTTADGGQVVLKSSGYSNWNLDNYSGRLRAYYDTTEYFTVTNSGNVGIGTNSPNSFQASANRLVIGNGSGNNGATIYAGSAAQAGIYFATGTVGSQAYAGQFIYNHADNSFLTYVNGTTLATKIDSSGNLLVGTTSVDATSAANCYIAPGYGYWYRNSTATQAVFNFRNPNGYVGSIQTSGSATAYNTSSDYRLKENVTTMTGALEVVSQLRPVNYTWKVDGTAGQGFIAHELAEIVPQCVSGEKDAVHEDGSIKPQGIDTSFLVATLTAAIQEQQTIIESLKTRIEALENK